MDSRDDAISAQPIQVEDEDAMYGATQQWQLLPLWCAESYEKLSDPARCVGCTHTARCNYGALQTCARALRTCPVAGCPVVVSSNALIRDDALRDAIEGLLSAAVDAPPKACWLRGAAELTFEKPGENDVTVEAPSVQLHLSMQSATGYRGVYASGGRFEARYQLNGKHTYIGSFRTAVDAAVAYAEHVRAHMEAIGKDGLVREAEVLRLHLAEQGHKGHESTTGYLGVREAKSGRFVTEHCVNGKRTCLGTFDTAVEAAVTYAKHHQSLGLDNEYVESLGLDDDGARVTKADGLRLHLAEQGRRTKHMSPTGYLGVGKVSSGRFSAQHQRDGKKTCLGTFDTAVEAAVAYAKHVKSLGATLEEDEEEVEMIEAEKVGMETSSTNGEVAEAAGLRLHLSEKNPTGYRGVRSSGGRFVAQHTLDGKYTYLGVFDTAVEAAVAYAKHRQLHGELVTNMSDEKMHEEIEVEMEVESDDDRDGYEHGERVTEAEGLRLHLAEEGRHGGKNSHGNQTASGYLGVYKNRAGRFEVKFKNKHIGTFATAVEGAIAYAKHEHSLSASLVGSFIDVWWPLDQAWYPARVLTYDEDTAKHEVKYVEDHVTEVLTLSEEEWRLVPQEDHPDGREVASVASTGLVPGPPAPAPGSAPVLKASANLACGQRVNARFNVSKWGAKRAKVQARSFNPCA